MVLNHMNYLFNLDKYDYIQQRYIVLNNRRKQKIETTEQSIESKNIPTWLKLIAIFSRPQVLRAALKFGLAALIMSRFERVGFALMMLCFAF